MKEILLLLVMFWNVENFFDPFDTPAVNDDTFTPRGEKFWTWKKFVKKRDDIAKVIMLIKQEYNVFPAIIGLCEVENRFVLNQLVSNTPLARVGYKIIHKDSPDSRGIDVAMLYNPAVFKVIRIRFFSIIIENGNRVNKDKKISRSSRLGKYNITLGNESIRVNSNLIMKDSLERNSIMASRLILYVKGVVNGLDTLHCFVNHWPSKLGGEKASLPRRMLVSNVVKTKTDSIFAENAKANVILMGDLNDTPGSLPVRNLDRFVNMTNELLKTWNSIENEGILPPGTHKYKERWEFIDQFLVSGNMAPQKRLIMEQERIERDLLDKGVVGKNFERDNFEKKKTAVVYKDIENRWIYCKDESMQIFIHSYLLQRDDMYLGFKLRKTLLGPKYLGGVSDHLPVILKIYGADF